MPLKYYNPRDKRKVATIQSTSDSAPPIIKMFETVNSHSVDDGVGLVADRGEKAEICPKKYRQHKRFWIQFQRQSDRDCDRSNNNGCSIVGNEPTEEHRNQE